MVAIFKTKNPVNILVLLVFGVLIKLPLFIHPAVVLPKETDGLFFQKILQGLQSAGAANPVLYSFIAFTILFLQAVAITRIVNTYRMMEKPNYFPGMTFLFVTSLFPSWNVLSAPMLVNCILLYILSGLLKTYNRTNVKALVFNIGLALGIAGFIYAPAILFFVWILFSLVLMRSVRPNEWILCLVGLVTPSYFYAMYLLITDAWSWQAIWPQFSMHILEIEQSIWLAGSAFLLVIPFLLGSYFVQDSLRKMLIQIRKSWSLVLVLLIIALLIPFVNNQGDLQKWAIMAVPIALFQAKGYMATPLRILPVLLFWMTLAFILCYQFLGPGWAMNG